MQNISEKLKFGRNDLVLEMGKYAKQAGGSVTVQYGGTVVLVTACMSREPREGSKGIEYSSGSYGTGFDDS